MIAEGTIVAGAKAGVISSLVAIVTTDVNLMMVITVGAVGGIGHVVKEFVMDDFKKSPILNTLNMMVSAAISMALVGFVFYLGIDAFNVHVKDIGVFVWIFLAFMLGVNQKRTIKFLLSQLDWFVILMKRTKK